MARRKNGAAQQSAAQQNEALHDAHIQAQQAQSAAEAFFRSRALIVVPQEPQALESDAPQGDEAMDDADIAAQQKAGDAAFDAAIESAMQAAESAMPARGTKRPYIRSSSIAKPTKKVWAIADSMIQFAESNDLPVPTRGEIIAECIKRGIASGTSATQYQHWKKANGR